MAIKKTMEKKSAVKESSKDITEKASARSSKKNDINEEDEDAGTDLEEPTPKKAKRKAVKGLNEEDDDEEDVVEPADEWEKTDDDNWDPDFDEFDVPASKIKKATSKKSKDDDDDLKLDDDFKEFGLFNEETGSSRSGRGGFDDDDDF